MNYYPSFHSLDTNESYLCSGRTADTPGEDARSAVAFTWRLHAEEGGHAFDDFLQNLTDDASLPWQQESYAKLDADSGAWAFLSPHPARPPAASRFFCENWCTCPHTLLPCDLQITPLVNVLTWKSPHQTTVSITVLARDASVPLIFNRTGRAQVLAFILGPSWTILASRVYLSPPLVEINYYFFIIKQCNI